MVSNAYQPRRPELGFPSLASLLPFIEAAAPNESKAWLIQRARSLEDYAALWIRSDHDNHELYLLAMVAYSGEILGSWAPRTSPDGQYHLILIPRTWISDGLQISREFVTRILSTRVESRKAWTVGRTEVLF